MEHFTRNCEMAIVCMQMFFIWWVCATASRCLIVELPCNQTPPMIRHVPLDEAGGVLLPFRKTPYSVIFLPPTRTTLRHLSTNGYPPPFARPGRWHNRVIEKKVDGVLGRRNRLFGSSLALGSQLAADLDAL